MKFINRFYILIMFSAISLVSSCRWYRVDKHTLLAPDYNLAYKDRVAISKAEEKVQLLLVEVSKLRDTRNSFSQYYKNGEDPVVWSNILRSFASEYNSEFDYDQYLEELTRLEVSLCQRAVMLALQIEQLRKDVH